MALQATQRAGCAALPSSRRLHCHLAAQCAASAPPGASCVPHSSQYAAAGAQCSTRQRPRWLQQRSQQLATRSAAFADAGAGADGGQGLVLFELEGAVVDMHMDGHRAAFNQAFKDLGYECVQWPCHIYHDLLSAGDGSPETLIRTYFQLMGWPTMLASSDQEGFVRNVHQSKQKALLKLLAEGAVPIRQGVSQVISDAVASGAIVGFLGGTLSEASDLVARNALAQLDPKTAQAIKLFSAGAVRQDERYSLEASDDEEGGGSGDGGAALGPTVGAMLRERQVQAKRNTAQQFVANFNAASMGISVDPSLLAKGSRNVDPQLLSAIAATMDVPLARCLVVAASSGLTEAAATAGMVAVAVPRRMANRGSFAGAVAKFTGFGAGDATWGRLASISKQPSSQRG